MLLVIQGGHKNVGDLLIKERGISLLGHVRPNQELVVKHRLDPTAADALCEAEAAVLCGGPGLTRNFYPTTFPLLKSLDETATPVLPLALGWAGEPMGHPERFAFDRSSLDALAKIHRRIQWSGVRDDLSLQVLQGARVGETRRTGCTAWYHLPSLGKAPDIPKRVRRLVVTTPAKWRKNSLEALTLLRELRSRYPDAERYCVFHRGLRAGNATTHGQALCMRGIAAFAKRLGYRVVDAAWRLPAIEFYGQADLHVGYRVHAHLAFTSQRRPSLLLCEDGRGVGQLKTLQDPYLLRAGDPDAMGKLHAALDVEEREGHPALQAGVEEIERTWPVMRETIEQLPAY